MSDTMTQNETRVSDKQPHEVLYWTNRFHCSEDQLRSAVTSVGNSSVAVAQYLKNHAG